MGINLFNGLSSLILFFPIFLGFLEFCALLGTYWDGSFGFFLPFLVVLTWFFWFVLAGGTALSLTGPSAMS